MDFRRSVSQANRPREHLFDPNGDQPSLGPAPWSAGADFGPHEQAAIEFGHMEQVAFLDVRPAAQPDSPHPATTVERMAGLKGVPYRQSAAGTTSR